MDAALRAELERIVGAGGVTDADVVIPATVDALVASARVLSAASARFTVRSGAAGAARAAPDADVTLSLNRLNAVRSAPQALTLRAEAGATIASVRSAASRDKLAIVGMPSSSAGEHVGGLIARGEVSRRSLCGVEAVLPSGERVHFGGGVLKDVVGYDIPALLLGSMGRLAIVAAVTFRLEPEAAATAVGAPPGVSDGGARDLVARAFNPQGLLRPGR